MKINIMNEYIELTKKQIFTYLKSIFEELYNEKYAELYTEKYINVRYYNFFTNNENLTVRKNVLEELKKTQEYIISNDLKNKELIEQIYVFFCYILYFDNVVYCKDIISKINKVSKLRKRVLNKENYSFEEDLYNKMLEINLEKEKLLEKFTANEFFLKITSYKNKQNVFRANLKYQLKFPMEYSEMAINKVFNTGITKEDKLTIEYYLIVVQVIKDIVKLNFKKQYIVEFAETLFAKPKKIKSLLNCIDNPAVQDKVSLKIRHEDFIENKDKVYELMREGYRFSIILDNSFEVNYKSIENLKMFKFVILNKEFKQYETIIKFNAEFKNNIIEI